MIRGASIRASPPELKGVDMSLVSTGDVRTWLNLAADDIDSNDKIASIAKAVQKFCDTYTGRILEVAMYENDLQYSRLDGHGDAWLYLPLYPVSHLSGLYMDSDREFGASTLISTADYYCQPDGKVFLDNAGIFVTGRQNIRADFRAGYAPVVGNTHNSAVGSYPVPADLKQVMVEMTVESMKEGITAIHTVESGESTKLLQMLSGNSFWKRTLDGYKNFAVGLGVREE